MKCQRCGEKNPAEIHTCSPPEQEPDVYGDGNVYRGQRSKESETKTIYYTAPPQRVMWLEAEANKEF